MKPKGRKNPVPKITEGMHVITLPAPEKEGGKSVLASLRLRKTDRDISSASVPIQTLSNLLWAASGINRKKGPFGTAGRTAASASNSQEVELYVALQGGFYLYEPLTHRLILSVGGDLRRLAISRRQNPSGAKAPVRLVYVVDINKFRKAGFQEPGLRDRETQKAYYYVDTGLMAGNVYLFAASQGLACWFHNCDKAGLAAKLGLGPNQSALFGQTIGYLPD